MPPPVEGESGFNACLHGENVAWPGNLSSVMRFGSVDLPEAVLRAQRENRLAIFAGAGVSIPAPTNLPGFEGLVRSIGRGEIQAPGEPFEQFLGRLAEKGISVHRRAAEILSLPGSESNVLHRDLVGLFLEAGTLRIVTTNFDCHLESEIAKRWPSRGSDIYEAPALPVGSRFSGLVYLHGRLGRFPDRLVLTDKDYGRAYLTEGWARRFVTSLYAEYVVLFVGYSYGDAPLRYLVRGLPAGYGPGRFALTESGDPQRWRYLGIEPIEYDPIDDHREVQGFFNKWVVLHQRGALAHEARLRKILELAPHEMLGDDESDLAYCLQQTELESFFFRHAHRPEWLIWADEKGLIAPLFDPATSAERFREQAWWFAKDALQKRGDVALTIAWTKYRTISRLLAVTIAHAIGVHFANENDHSQDAGIRASNWLYLISRRCDLSCDDVSSLLISHLCPENHAELATWWFLHLLQPVFELEVPFDEQSGPARIGVPRHRDIFDLQHAWDRLFLPHLDRFAPRLLAGLTTILEKTRLQLGAGGAIRRGWDSLDFERPAIADHEQNRFGGRGRVQVLLTAARDIIDWYLKHRPKVAAATIEIWLESEATQLRRLGLYGLTKLGEPPANKIQRVIDSDWLDSIPLKHEIFELLRACYPALKTPIRRRFLKTAKISLDPETPGREADEERSNAYSFYNLLIWLQKADPNCTVVSGGLAEIARRFPEFQPRDHPDFEVVHGEVGWVRAVSPIQQAELLAMTPAEWLEAYNRIVGRPERIDHLVDEPKGFLEETGKAAIEDSSWGFRLASALGEWGFWEHVAWQFLLSSWREHSFDQAEWRELTSVLNRDPLLHARAEDVIDFLERWSTRKGSTPSEGQWTDLLNLSRKLWDLARGRSPAFSIDQIGDWMQVAINCPAGKLAQFALYASSGLQKLSPEVKEIPSPVGALLARMCRTVTMPEQLAACVLASRLHYFLWLAPEWTREWLLPRFNWEEPLRAGQAWHGFLYGRVITDQVPILVVLIEDALPHLGEFGELRDRFSKMIAEVAYLSPDRPLDARWFRSYLGASNDRDRREFTWRIDSILDEIEIQDREAFWRSWLANYFRERFSDAPPLEHEERAALALWALHLLPWLAELAEVVKGKPSPTFKAQRILSSV